MKRIILAAMVMVFGGLVLFAQASKSTADFKKDEILCGKDEGGPAEIQYWVGKVLKQASPETKNQFQVLYIQNGAKAWVNYVFPSHKAKKEELVIDAIVFYPAGWEEYNDMSVDDYRKASWAVGRVTATDDMFKDLVEVGGSKFNWKFIRVPDDPTALEAKSE